MLFQNRKPLPVVFMILAVLYFVYVVGSGSSQMIGDELGGDPGGMLLPMVLSIFMFIASVYLFITDRPAADRKPVRLGKEERQLFLLTIVVAIGYVFLSRLLGFILSTSLVLFSLSFANLRAGLFRKDCKVWLVGLVSTTVLILGVYSAGRVTTRSLLMAGRQGAIPAWLGSTGMVVFLTLLVVSALIVMLLVLTRTRFSVEHSGAAVHSMWLSAMVSIISVEFLYLVFRQMFYVELVKGLITW